MHPFDLNLRHLRAAHAIAARGRMSAAAAAVSLSQPALTQGLAKLERQLGVALFERRPGGMAPTAAGAILADRAAAAIAHIAAGARGGGGFARPEHLVTSAQARAFLALADQGSFVGAAAATGLSQPAIHRAVRDLEQVIGLPIVARAGRTVALGNAGRRLAMGLRLAQREIAAALADIGGTPAERSGPLVVGAMPLCRARLLPDAIARCLAAAPAMRFDVVEGSWRELVGPLREGALDLMVGALRPPADVPDLDQLALCEDRLIVAGARDHPLAGAAEVPRAQLAVFPWIIGRAGTPLRDQWETLFAGRALPPAPIECGSVMTIRELLIGSAMLTLLSPAQIGPELRAGLLVPIGAPLSGSARTIGVATRAGWRPSRTQQIFLDMLKASAAETALQHFE